MRTVVLRLLLGTMGLVVAVGSSQPIPVTLEPEQQTQIYIYTYDLPQWVVRSVALKAPIQYVLMQIYAHADSHVHAHVTVCLLGQY